MDIKKINEKIKQTVMCNLQMTTSRSIKKIHRLREENFNTNNEIINEIFDYCQKNNITSPNEFDDTVKGLACPLGDIMESFEGEFYGNLSVELEQMDSIKKEYYTKVLDIFKLDDDLKYEYMGKLARTYYSLGKENNANELLEKIKREDSNCPIPYIEECHFEQSKEKWDIAKIENLLKEIEKRNGEEEALNIYYTLEQYYSDKKDTKKAKYYENKRCNIMGFNPGELLDFSNMDEEDLDEVFGNLDMFESKEQRLEEEEIIKARVNEIITTLKSMCKNNDVSKDKLFEDYIKNNKVINEKGEELELSFNYIGMIDSYIIYNNGEKIDENNIFPSDATNYILDKKDELIKSIAYFIPEEFVESLVYLMDNNYLELRYDELYKIYDKLDVWITLQNVGIIFMKAKKNSLIIHLPDDLLNSLKKLFVDKEVIKIRKDMFKIYQFYSGAIEAYGAILLNDLFKIFSKVISNNKKEFTVSLMLYVCYYGFNCLPLLDEETKAFRGIYHTCLNEEQAMDIIMKNKDREYKIYPKNRYKKFITNNELLDSEALMRFAIETTITFPSIAEDAASMFVELLRDYLKTRRTDEKKAKNMVKLVISGSFGSCDISCKELYDFLIDHFEKLYSELPDWNNGGRIKKIK